MRSRWIALIATGVALVLGAGLWSVVGVAALAVSITSSIAAPTWESAVEGPAGTTPTAEDLDPFAVTEVYEVGADGTLTPEPTPAAAEVWASIERVFTPRGAATRIEQLRLGDDASNDTMAWVSHSRTPEYWTFGANLAYVDADDLWMSTVVHEYAHVLSLGSDSVDPFTDTCDTMWTTQGCLFPDADLLTFSERFWSGYSDAPDSENEDVVIADAFYAAHEEDFISGYAATNVVEDFAETFTAFVTEDPSDGDDVLSRKIAFFGEYPQYVLVRERLRADLGWG